MARRADYEEAVKKNTPILYRECITTPNAGVKMVFVVCSVEKSENNNFYMTAIETPENIEKLKEQYGMEYITNLLAKKLNGKYEFIPEDDDTEYMKNIHAKVEKFKNLLKK